MKFILQYPQANGLRRDMLDAGDVGEMAAAAEKAGFDGFSLTEHPIPGAKWLAQGGHQSVDPFVALAFAAAATTRLRLLTYLAVVPYRNPFLLAKGVGDARPHVQRTLRARRRQRLPQDRVLRARRRLPRAQRALRRGARSPAARVERRGVLAYKGPPLRGAQRDPAAATDAAADPGIWIGGNSSSRGSASRAAAGVDADGRHRGARCQTTHRAHRLARRPAT